MLQAENLAVSLGGRRLLSGISLEAGPGRLTAIVGPNGSGKTTLLRAMTGDLRYEGRIRLNGQEVAEAHPRALAALRAVLTQETQVAFPFTVEEIVMLGLEQGQGGSDAASLLAQVDLPGFGPRPYHELSGGEQQRAHLARVLGQIGAAASAEGPRWLFLDEPVSSLDIGHQLMIMQLARNFAEAGGGVIAVMHDLNLTAMFADHVALLCKGGLRAFGRPEEVLTEPHLEHAFGCRLRINTPPSRGVWLLPQTASHG